MSDEVETAPIEIEVEPMSKFVPETKVKATRKVKVKVVPLPEPEFETPTADIEAMNVLPPDTMAEPDAS